MAKNYFITHYLRVTLLTQDVIKRDFWVDTIALRLVESGTTNLEIVFMIGSKKTVVFNQPNLHVQFMDQPLITSCRAFIPKKKTGNTT